MILFRTKQRRRPISQKKNSEELMDKIFNKAKSITIQNDLNIDEIMNDMNNAIS